MGKGKPRWAKKGSRVKKSKKEKLDRQRNLRYIGFTIGSVVCLAVLVGVLLILPPPTPQVVAVRIEISVASRYFTWDLTHVHITGTFGEDNPDLVLPGHAWLGYIRKHSTGEYYNFEQQQWQEEVYRLEKRVGSAQNPETVVWQASLTVGTEVDIYFVLSTVANEIIQDIAIVGVVKRGI